MAEAQVIAGTEQWTTVREAAAATGLPPRTVYNWVKTGTLRAKTEGKTKLVDLHEVQRLAAERGPSVVPFPRPAPALPRGLPAGAPAGVQVDGELASRLFARFDEGVTPGEIVRDEQLPPALVGNVFHQHRQLQDLAGAKGERLPDIVKANAKAVSELRAQLARIDHDLGQEFSGQAKERAQQAQRLDELTGELRSQRQVIDNMARLVANIYGMLNYRSR